MDARSALTEDVRTYGVDALSIDAAGPRRWPPVEMTLRRALSSLAASRSAKACTHATASVTGPTNGSTRLVRFLGKPRFKRLRASTMRVARRHTGRRLSYRCRNRRLTPLYRLGGGTGGMGKRLGHGAAVNSGSSWCSSPRLRAAANAPSRVHPVAGFGVASNEEAPGETTPPSHGRPDAPAVHSPRTPLPRTHKRPRPRPRPRPPPRPCDESAVLSSAAGASPRPRPPRPRPPRS